MLSFTTTQLWCNTQQLDNVIKKYKSKNNDIKIKIQVAES